MDTLNYYYEQALKGRDTFHCLYYLYIDTYAYLYFSHC